jgi:hypothetical protein
MRSASMAFPVLNWLNRTFDYTRPARAGAAPGPPRNWRGAEPGLQPGGRAPRAPSARAASKSIGIGNTMVEVLSPAMLASVCM